MEFVKNVRINSAISLRLPECSLINYLAGELITALMEFYSARKFLVICIIGLIVFGLIAFLSPNRNVQMATMIIVKILGAVGIIALIIFLVARSKRRKEEY